MSCNDDASIIIINCVIYKKLILCVVFMYEAKYKNNNNNIGLMFQNPFLIPSQSILIHLHPPSSISPTSALNILLPWQHLTAQSV